jgi:hypothetical protein
VLARFRIELAAALIPFAALTVVETARALADGRIARAALLSGCVFLLGLWMGRPLSSRQRLIRMADWILPYSAYYQPRVSAAVDAGDWHQAGTWYLESFRFEPDAGQIVASGDPSLAPELADMHMECARILNMAGEAGLAQAQADRAQRILALSGASPLAR